VGLLAACGSQSNDSASTGSGGDTGTGQASTKPVKMVLSNNFMGNEFRPQMVNGAKVVADSSVYKGKIDLEVKISEPTPASQISSLQGIIRDKPDAILIEAASPTALNPTIQQACNAGIVVVTFDQSATAPCAYKYISGYEDKGADIARWAIAQLGGKGNVILDQGIPGTPISNTYLAQWKKILAEEAPDIKVVGQYASSFTDGPEEQGVSRLLAKNPNIDGVLSDYSCDAVLSAFKKAGQTPKAIACHANNRRAIACEETKTPCYLYTTPASLSSYATDKAYQIVTKQISPPKEEVVDLPNYVSSAATTDFDNKLPIEKLAPGKNYYPDESPALVLPVSFGDLARFNITPAGMLGQ
jgi:ribose transport system substrate-binding protein